MEIEIESFEKNSATSAGLYVVLADKENLLGEPPGNEKIAWQTLIDQVLKKQSKKLLAADQELFPFGDRGLLVLQLPKKKGLDRWDCLRLAAGSAWETAKSRSAKNLCLSVNLAGTEDIRAILEGLLYAAYDFRPYKSEPPKNSTPPAVKLWVNSQEVKSAQNVLSETRIVFRHLDHLRDWVNTPGSDLTPPTFAAIAQESARRHGLEIVVRDEKKIHKEGWMGLWTVGKGSDHPPRLVTLTYAGGAPKTRGTNHLCIVGKGVTFDTGGISLKPGAGMAEMKCDMAGAATALAAVCAAAELKLPLRVSAVLCLAENRPGNAAVLPGDVFTARNGKTVMVDNTDAEGRLVLSDGLFAAGQLQATHVIDIATLTGSVVRALGPALAGLFANDRDFGAAIRSMGERVSEKFWELPLEEEYREWLDDSTADFKNVSSKSEAGAIIAALFLAEFVPAGAKWSHWDVAGTAFINSNWKYFKPGATGFGLKTLMQIARTLA